MEESQAMLRSLVWLTCVNRRLPRGISLVSAASCLVPQRPVRVRQDVRQGKMSREHS